MLKSAIKQQINSELKRIDTLIRFTERRRGRISFKPDSTLLVWEHLGLLGNGQYSDNTLEKLNKYLDCGFTAGENLFITSDNIDGNTNELAILDTLEQIERRIDGTDHKSKRKRWVEQV